MKKIYPITLIAICTFFFNCSSDDNANTNPPDETTLSEVIAAITNNGDSKTWKIENAALTNSNTTSLDVTSAFNIKDDEFLFTANSSNSGLSLEHKQRNDFNRNAGSSQEFLLDYYKSPINYNLSSNASDIAQFADASGNLSFVYANDTITGEWQFDASSKLTFTLTEKTANDYQTSPTSLTFSEVATIPSEFAFLDGHGSSDALASQSDNSIFIVYSTDAFVNPNGESPRAEGVIKYDIEANAFTNNIYHRSDFFTKRVAITNNQLKVVGTQFINTYDLNLNADPSTFAYNAFSENVNSYLLLRHDLVFNNDDMYVLGGNSQADIDPDNPDSYLDNVYVLSPSAQQLSESTTMPGPKSQAASELVDHSIYTFSGQRGFSNQNTAETTCYKYNLATNSFSSFNMPQALNISYTASVENLIYVAGQVYVFNADGSQIDNNAYLGVYNTEDETFTEITHNLDDSDTSSRISGMAYANNKLYMVYGNSTNVTGEGTTAILSADLQ